MTAPTSPSTLISGLNWAPTGVYNLTDEELLQELNNDLRDAVLWVSIYFSIEAVLGFFGNLLVLYVFAFRYHECNFRYFVLCLASVDFLSCLTTIPGEVVTQHYWYTFPDSGLCKAKSFFNVFTISAEAFCLFAIAVDRYRKVCTPFGRQITPRVAKVLCVVVYVCAFIFGSATGVLWGTHKTQKIYKNRTIMVTVCEKDQKYVHSSAPLGFITATEVIVGTVLTTMFTLYALVARRLIINRTSSDMETEVGGATSVHHLSVHQTQIELSSTDGYSSTDTASKSGGSRSKDESSNVYTTETSDSNGTKDGKPTTTKSSTLRSLNKKSLRRNSSTMRIRRKTKIMLFLTIIFFTTSIMYLTLLDYIARSGDKIVKLSEGQRSVYFFFLRFVFINHVINPVVYGFWDRTFKKVVNEMKEQLLHSLSKWFRHVKCKNENNETSSNDNKTVND